MTSEREKLTPVFGMEKCCCGHPSCKDWWLTGIGKFVRGSGFTENEAKRILAALTPAPKVDERDICVPGVFRCAKCGFQLSQSTLNARDGTVTARDAPGEKCPNDGSPMWRVTWREYCTEQDEGFMSLLDRKDEEIKRLHKAVLEAVELAKETPYMNRDDREPAINTYLASLKESNDVE